MVTATSLVADAADVVGRAGKVRKIIYKKTPQGELAIHVHFPTDWKASDNRSAIVFFFGGGWRGGSVNQFRRQAEYLATRGMVTARADYRIKSKHSFPLVDMLNTIEVSSDVSVEAHRVQDYRFVLVLRGEGLGHQLSDTDPQTVGGPPRQAAPKGPQDSAAERTAYLINSFVKQANTMLEGHDPANSLLLRGFSREPVDWPDFGRSYKLNPGAIAGYPMYRGLAKITGMTKLEAGDSFDSELRTLEKHYDDHDYFFLHYKPADGAGEDADFDMKVRRLEELDAQIPRILALNPDVLIVAGDHSTPSIMGGHSWHSVPLLIKSQLTAHLGVERFTERACSLGTLGHRPATDVMILALAHAGKLKKFGA
ncbi:MAG: phosphoglycerate mutase [Chloroflexi bacterium]|nr:phosphoglycerate mutase [Chloroflexota bacterium]